MNGGALALREGVLFWGLHEKRARVQAFDLDGHPLEIGFGVGAEGELSSVSGLAADGDRRLWLADTVAGRVRGINLFGREAASFVAEAGELEAPAGGLLDGPVDVCLAPGETYSGLWVAVGGVRRAAVGLHLPDGTRLSALRSEGHPQRAFQRVVRLAARGEELWVLEAGARRVQVFRRGEFHFAFDVPGERSWPSALWPLADGRLVLALAGEGSAVDGDRVLLCDGGGRVLRVLIEGLGPGDSDLAPPEGRVLAPVDLVVDEAGSDAASRLVLCDLDGARIQVFNLAGRCYGTFADFEQRL